MSNETPAPEATETTTEAPAVETAPAQEPTDWKAEARKWEERAKANKTAAEKLAEIEESSKSEAQKLAERAEAAEKALAEAQADALRSRVIAKHGIPEDYHDFVVGDSAEALEAKAEKVKKLIEAQAQPNTKHVSIPGEGNTPTTALNGDGIESALRHALGIQ